MEEHHFHLHSMLFRLEIRQIWEQSLNRPVWVLLELLVQDYKQLRLLLPDYPRLRFLLLLLLVLLERLQLLHVLPAFLFLFCSRWVFFLPARHPHSILRLRHVTNSP